MPSIPWVYVVFVSDIDNDPERGRRREQASIILTELTESPVLSDALDDQWKVSNVLLKKKI